MRTLAAACIIAAAACIVPACSEEVKRYVPNVGDSAATPTMTTTDVNTLISDSGYTRYHLQAPLWRIFDEAAEPYWDFPDGLFVEQYDLAMNPAANVTADSAVYFSRKRLWRLDGNVVMVNNDADSFLTQQIFWNQAERTFHTDSFIHIVRADRILEGYGFTSDENMTDYVVTRPTAILPAETLPGQQRAGNKTAADTAKHKTEPQPGTPADTPEKMPLKRNNRVRAITPDRQHVK